MDLLFQQPATEFYDDLAILAGELSQAANDVKDNGITSKLRSLGFKHYKSFNYGYQTLVNKNSSAVTFAEARMETSTQSYQLIVIVTRGTESLAEMVGDAFKGSPQDFLGTKIRITSMTTKK